jgi:predicted nucleotidyltransferase
MTGGESDMDRIVDEIVRAVVEASNPERIILFGSAARGDVGPDSDLDILIVEKESAFRGGSRWDESSHIRRALWRFPIPIDVLLFTPEEMDKWKNATNHIVARSLREGKVVYDRS